MAKSKSSKSKSKKMSTNKQSTKPAVNEETKALFDVPLMSEPKDPEQRVSMTRREFSGMIRNATTMTRASLFNNFLNRGLDINFECRYPDVISINMYKMLYERNGTASRVVKLWPEETWAVNPDIIENEDADETAFEKKWKELDNQSKVFHYLKRVDILSGIGEFGVLLIGIDDGKKLSEPVDGINEVTGEKSGNKEHKILYLKPFDQLAVKIDQKETDPSSPRFGMPKAYSIEFSQDSVTDPTSSADTKVHWTRILHIADNRESSETYGVPRMRHVYNSILDIRKILGGSGEMFWKGAFQGLSFETQQDAESGTLDIDSLKDQMEKYGSGMQRYLATEGMNVNTLSPTLSSPKDHIDANKRDIAISMGVPWRIFLGTEESKLASTQDAITWNRRLGSRQNNYATPYIIRTFIDRLIALGVLPEVEYMVVWPDLNTPSDLDIAAVADKLTSALAKYVAGGVDTMVPEKEFLMIFLKKTEEEADAILKNAIGLQNVEPEPDEDPDTGNDDDE